MKLPSTGVAIALALGACVASGIQSRAQNNLEPTTISKDAAQSLTTLQIPHLSREPKLEDFADMVPSAEVAGTMLKVDQFTQRDPKDGAPVSQRTEAYLGYTDKNLYAIFLAFDTDMNQVRGHMVRREQINDEDQVGFFLDTFHDRRHALFFYINPAGVQQEGTYLEGQDIDLSWDTVWTSETKIYKQGWVGYISIPFKSLRFKSTSEVQQWGFLLERDIPHNGEHSFFPKFSTHVQGLLSQEGDMGGFAHISPGRNLQLIPYASFRSFRVVDPRDPLRPTYDSGSFQPKAGLDAKAVIKDSLVLDATLNPDFGQVESDEPQVTVNQRFEVFFPEKRPFFQENSSYFSTPINLVFTRRIVDPLYGIRLTGKLGRWSIGTLFADDQSPGESVAPNDPLYGHQAYFTIARVSREIGSQGSSIGFLFTDRELQAVPNTSCIDDACTTKMNRVGGWMLTSSSMSIGRSTRRRWVAKPVSMTGPTIQAPATSCTWIEPVATGSSIRCIKTTRLDSRPARVFFSVPTSGGSVILCRGSSTSKANTCNTTGRASSRETSGITTACVSNTSLT